MTQSGEHKLYETDAGVEKIVFTADVSFFLINKRVHPKIAVKM